MKYPVFFVCLLAGCSVNPVAVENITTRPDVATGTNVEPAGGAQGVRHPGPVEPGTNKPSAASDLIAREAEQQFKLGHWSQTVQLAERGLRIDRHNAHLYLLLAKTYAELGNGERSAQFARQGLSYTDVRNKPLRAELESLVSTAPR